MLYDWQYKHERTTHKLLFQTKFEEFFHASYSSRHINKNILTHRFHHVEASSVHHLVFVGAFFLSAITLLPISLPSAKPTLSRRIAVDLSNREERSTHSLERLQSFFFEQKTTRDIRFRCVVFPPCVFFSSSHLSFLPLTLSSLCLLFYYVSRVFEPPSTLRGLRMPRATDWLTEQRARGRRERTSNSSVPNVAEYSRTLSNAIRPTIVRARTSLARLPSKIFDNPWCNDTLYVFLWITRTIIFKSYLFFSVDIPFFRGICPSVLNATSRKE